VTRVNEDCKSKMIVDSNYVLYNTGKSDEIKKE